MLTCQSCGMPMDKAEDHGAALLENPYCRYCTDSQGKLLPKETVRQKMMTFFVKTMGKSEDEAAFEVDKVMSRMPAWQIPAAMPQATTMMDTNDTTTTAPEPVTPEPPASGPGQPTGPAPIAPVSQPTPPVTPAPEPVTPKPGPAEPVTPKPGPTTDTTSGPSAPEEPPAPKPLV